YCNTMRSEHPDNARFFEDVQRWLGRKITVIQSDRYSTVDEVYEGCRYMSGVSGARCTTELKKLPRLAFQQTDDIHVFGYTADEWRRSQLFEKHNPALFVEWVLHDEQINKQGCKNRLEEAGIR